MILSDNTIRDMISKGSLIKSPIEDIQIQPASLDIRLGDTFAVIEDSPDGILDMESPISYKTIRSDTYLLLPGQFVLATTMEYLDLPDDMTAFVEGRSSLGRMGLFIQNAGWVDPGFKGEITLELFNANRFAIRLTPGRRVGQLVFAKMDMPAESPIRANTRIKKELSDQGYTLVPKAPVRLFFALLFLRRLFLTALCFHYFTYKKRGHYEHVGHHDTQGRSHKLLQGRSLVVAEYPGYQPRTHKYADGQKKCDTRRTHQFRQIFQSVFPSLKLFFQKYFALGAGYPAFHKKRPIVIYRAVMIAAAGGIITSTVSDLDVK